jgi:hypothetical protein
MSEKMEYEELLDLLDQIETYDLVEELSYRGIYTEDEDKVDIYDATNRQLIDVLSERGYTVVDDDLAEAQLRWERGDKKEALFLLERELDLHGLSSILN